MTDQTGARESLFTRLDRAGQFSGLDIEQTLLRVERNFHNEVAQRGGDEIALRLVGKWLAGVEYREWTLLVEDRKNLLAEVERLTAALHK